MTNCGHGQPPHGISTVVHFGMPVGFPSGHVLHSSFTVFLFFFMFLMYKSVCRNEI